ncbi:MAG: 5-formyltetrahydrofolate cyclo-ligase [Endozoicomonadaceae bacterium]|nr:5-formyltetrahydrofolate cyclo-ligase [Endozoicomonadaceae bacterium]
MTPEQPSLQKKPLRQILRACRRQLTPLEQHQASHNLGKILCRQSFYLRSQRIALYLSHDGEVDPTDIARKAWKQGKQCYLPVLHPLKPSWLQFLPWFPSSRMKKNRFGIPEPDARFYQSVPVWSLDLVLLPLTGFDQKGNRMGMGGGFYDRTFAFIHTSTKTKVPQLIGLAHECQRVAHLPINSWDIPLSGIVSDKQFYPAF